MSEVGGQGVNNEPKPTQRESSEKVVDYGDKNYREMLIIIEQNKQSNPTKLDTAAIARFKALDEMAKRLTLDDEAARIADQAIAKDMGSIFVELGSGPVEPKKMQELTGRAAGVVSGLLKNPEELKRVEDEVKERVQSLSTGAWETPEQARFDKEALTKGELTGYLESKLVSARIAMSDPEIGPEWLGRIAEKVSQKVSIEPVKRVEPVVQTEQKSEKPKDDVYSKEPAQAEQKLLKPIDEWKRDVGVSPEAFNKLSLKEKAEWIKLFKENPDGKLFNEWLAGVDIDPTEYANADLEDQKLFVGLYTEAMVAQSKQTPVEAEKKQTKAKAEPESGSDGEAARKRSESIATLDPDFVAWLEEARSISADEFIDVSPASRANLRSKYESVIEKKNKDPKEKADMNALKEKVASLEKENGNPGWIKQVFDEVARTGTAVLVAEVIDHMQAALQTKKSAYEEAQLTLKIADEDKKATSATLQDKGKLEAAAAIVRAFERQAQKDGGAIDQGFKKELRGEADDNGNIIINGAISKVLEDYIQQAQDFRATRSMGNNLGDPAIPVKEALDKAFERRRSQLRAQGELTSDAEVILQKYREGFNTNLRLDRLIARRNLYSELGSGWRNQLRAVDEEIKRVQEEAGDTSTKNTAANATRGQMREVFQDWWENEGASEQERAQIRAARINPDVRNRVPLTRSERLRQKTEEYMASQNVLPEDIDKFRSGDATAIETWMAGKLVEMDSSKRKVVQKATKALNSMLVYLEQFRPELRADQDRLETRFDNYETLQEAAGKIAGLEGSGGGLEAVTAILKADYSGANFPGFVHELKEFLPMQIKVDAEKEALRAWLSSGNSAAARERLKDVMFGEVAAGETRSQDDELKFIEYLARMQMLGTTSLRDAYLGKNKPSGKPVPPDDKSHLDVFNRTHMPKFSELQRFEITSERKRSLSRQMAIRYNMYLPDYVSVSVLQLAKPAEIDQMGFRTGVVAFTTLSEKAAELDFSSLDVNSPTAYCSSVEKALKTQAMLDKMWGINGLKDLWNQGFLHLNGLMPKEMEKAITPKEITGLFDTGKHKVDLSLRDFALVNLGLAAVYQEQISYYLDPKTNGTFMTTKELNSRLDQLFVVGSRYDARLTALKEIVSKTDWFTVKKAFEKFDYSKKTDMLAFIGNLLMTGLEVGSIAIGESLPGGLGKSKK